MRHWFCIFLVFVPFPIAGQAATRSTLSGHVRADLAQIAAVDRLPATNRLQLAIGLPFRNREALTNLLEQLYDPASANFHHYLMPEQFAERFGPTEEDYQAAIDFAKANGLTVTALHPNRMLLSVSGTVAEIERTFQVTLRVYPHPTERRTFFAPAVEPSVDARIQVFHVSGLNNYTLPRPMSLWTDPLVTDPSPKPHGGSGPNGTYIGNDFRLAYGAVAPLTGAGQSVGLIEFDGYFASDIFAYASQAGIPNVPLRNVLVDGFDGIPTSSAAGSGNEEVALDIEMAISMAPGLSEVTIYEGSPDATGATLNHILNRMATDNLAKQLSCSWGFDIDVTTQQIFQQYAAQGQSFFLASGDSGAFVGAIEQPSDDPFVIVVGGTVLTTGSSRFWLAETTWTGSSGGISTLYPIPSWQQGINMTANKGSTTRRNLPDVAMVASNVLLVADNGQRMAGAGTSFSAPLWAGFAALINQQASARGKPPIGFLNPALYAIGKGSSYASDFHDITTGNTTHSGSPSLFFAVTGYDLCTGWGTPAGTNLINTLLSLPADSLTIQPPFGFTANGSVGGPFNVTFQNYSLSNSGTSSINWALVNTSAWLTVSPTGGSLAPGGPAALLTVSLNPAASNLLIGAYTATVTFSNLNDGVSQNRQFELLAGNGGFETGDFSNWTLSTTGAVFADSIDQAQLNGSPTIPGIDDGQFVHSGIYGAFLGQAGSLGYISQTIPTATGQPYLLSFWLDNPAVGIPNEFLVSWNGNTLFHQVDLGSFGWTNFHYVVTATGTTAVLQFGFRNDPNALGLDDVTVQLIPAPNIQTAANNTTITLNWNSLPGLDYQVQSTTGLTPIRWQNQGGRLTATNTTSTVSDSITTSSQRFYRVIVP